MVLLLVGEEERQAVAMYRGSKKYELVGFFMSDFNSHFILGRIWPTLCEDPYLFMPKDVTDETIGDGFFIAKKNGEVCGIF